MVFSSLFFTFFFFVVVMAICAFVQWRGGSIRAGNIVLLTASLVFYAWGGPLLLLLLCGMTFACWGGALLIERSADAGRKKTWLTLTLAVCLGLLGFFKYANLFAATFIDIFGLSVKAPSIVLPIGISFYTFQLLSYVVDVKRGEVPAQKKYWLLLLYASLFHQCIAGPIVRYADVEREITGRTVNAADVSRGITRFSVGLAKKALLANFCGAQVEVLLPMTREAVTGASSLTVFLAGVFYMLQIYLDFSAYSDMAIGMGLMVGFHYKENFDYPYLADSVTDFWRRWHISLGSFFRDYVYIPLGGNRVPVARHIFNLLVVWALTGFWHGASWNYLLWGLYFFVFLVTEKYLLRPERDPDPFALVLRRIVTLAVVYFGWFLFRFEDMSLLGPALGALFGSHAGADLVGRLALRNNFVFLAAAILACTPIVPFLDGKLKTAAKSSPAAATVRKILSVSLPVLLLFLSLCSLVGDTYNPFMYTRF